MSDIIINNINVHVGYDDMFFILGDVLFGNKQYLPIILNRINCKNVYLILGNHDTYIENNPDYIKLFKGVYDTVRLEIDKKINIILSHYAHRTWAGYHKGWIHLYGHSHGTLDGFGKSMDVGVDAIFNITNAYKPIDLYNVLKIMNKKEIVYPDRHIKNEYKNFNTLML